MSNAGKAFEFLSGDERVAQCPNNLDLSTGNQSPESVCIDAENPCGFGNLVSEAVGFVL